MHISVLKYPSLLLGVLICFSFDHVSLSTALSISPPPLSGTSDGREAIDFPNKINKVISYQYGGISASTYGSHGGATHQPSTALIPYSKRGISLSNFLGRWNIIYNDTETFQSSPSTINDITKFYTDILTTIGQSINAPPSKYLSFTKGRLQLIISSASQAIPWDMAEEITKFMIKVGRMGFPEFASLSFSIFKGAIFYSLAVNLVVLAFLVPPRVEVQNIINGRKRDIGDLCGVYLPDCQ